VQITDADRPNDGDTVVVYSRLGYYVGVYRMYVGSTVGLRDFTHGPTDIT